MFQRTKLARKLAEDCKWEVVQELPRPLQSSALAKLHGEYSEMASLWVESSSRQCKLELLFQWDDLTVSASRLWPAPGAENSVSRNEEKWETERVVVQNLTGVNFKEKMVSLFTENAS